MSELEKTFDILYKIYNKHRRQHPENSFDSKQICLMWSTDDPPDEIEGTGPFNDIEEAFKIAIDDEDALELYDMTLEEASIIILEIQGVM
ncbi:MAG: hypothetical protein NTV00_07510 [Methylococcales bacterium]|nr:hypothetical protein [Methylococcales bacterium]